MIFIAIILILSLFLESNFSTFPFVLLFLILVAITSPKKVIFFWAFLAGLLLDGLTFNWPGKSSLFFLIFVYIIILYQQKFEADSIKFVMIFTFIGSYLYLLVMETTHAFFISILSSLLSVLLLKVYNSMNRKLNYSSKW